MKTEIESLEYERSKVRKDLMALTVQESEIETQLEKRKLKFLNK